MEREISRNTKGNNNINICRMKKIIKKYGNAIIINFTIDEQEIYELKEGDIIDLTIIKHVPKRKKSKSRRKLENEKT